MLKHLLITLTLISVNSFAIEFEPAKFQRFENQNCEQNNTCDLVSMEVKTRRYKIWIIDGMNYGTQMYASYKTKTVKDLPNYGIVQFIKGCVFSSYNVNNEIINYHDVSRDLFSESVKFYHPNWVIDSFDSDPMYSSFPDSPMRHAAYRWNASPKKLYEDKSKIFYGKKTPTWPVLYVRDSPSNAFLMGSARNVSLKFQTCLYKAEDIPLVGTPESMNPADAIHCMNWMHSYIYNFDTKKYESPTEIHPFCL